VAGLSTPNPIYYFWGVTIIVLICVEVTSVNECMCHVVGPTLLSCTNGQLPCVTRIVQSAELCCHVALGAEVALSWLATWHAGGVHLSGQYGDGAHSAEVDP
jgi:hypothetical protein